MTGRRLAVLALGLVGCGGDVLTIEGTVVNAGGSLVMVEAVPYGIWTGEETQDSVEVYPVTETTDDFDFQVPAGEWAVVGAVGTCMDVEKVSGVEGEVVTVELELVCSE